MSEQKKPEIGSIAWTDLTIANAEGVRDFYSEVIGWKSSPVSMGDYSDFNMNTPESGKPVAGICHARGVNADLPAQWMMYIIVVDIEKSTSRCKELGGKLLTPVKNMGGQGRYCVIQDPAGAVAALYEITYSDHD